MMHRILVEVSDYTGYSSAYTEARLEELRRDINKFLWETFDTENLQNERCFAVSVAYVESDEFVLYADNVKL